MADLGLTAIEMAVGMAQLGFRDPLLSCLLSTLRYNDHSRHRSLWSRDSDNYFACVCSSWLYIVPQAYHRKPYPFNLEHTSKSHNWAWMRITSEFQVLKCDHPTSHGFVVGL